MMHIDGVFSVFVGAMLIWTVALQRAVEALDHIASNDWGLAAWKALVSVCTVFVGFSVWGAA